MGNKSVQKKKYIVETATKVFSERGFKQVTMKDIVEACDISRGGLYLYFADTREIFEAVLALRTRAGLDVLKNVNAEELPDKVLITYLEEKKKEISRKKDNLEVAIFEYLFEMKSQKRENPVKKAYQEERKALEKLIADGVEQKRMVCEDPKAAAKNIMLMLEGVKVTAQTYGITADMTEQALAAMLSSVGLDAK